MFYILLDFVYVILLVLKTVHLSAKIITGFIFAVTFQSWFCIHKKKHDMRTGVSNSDFVSAPVLISLEHLTNVGRRVWVKMLYFSHSPFLHDVIKAMIYLESPKDLFFL